MMNITFVVYEDCSWQQMLPLTYLRPTFELICGRNSLLEKIQRLIASASAASANGNGKRSLTAPSLWCRPELAPVLAEDHSDAVNQRVSGPAVFLNGRGWWKRLPSLDTSTGSWIGVVGESEHVACIVADAELAESLSPDQFQSCDRMNRQLADLPRRDVSEYVEMFSWPWELVHANERALLADWESSEVQRAQRGRLDVGSYVLAPESVHLGQGTRIKPCAVIDAEDGPVWIGDDVTISPHTSIKGPVSIGNGSLIQPGAVIHAGTTIGPVCKVGGEIEASIIQGYSNKQHDGFLGHSYIGSWVNIAADCINSDLKNTYGTVRVPINGRPVETGEMFVGMLVGDYSKLGINVSFPTGSVIGFCSSVFASQSPKFVPSFVWVDGDTWTAFDEERGVEIAGKVMARRNRCFTPVREQVFRRIRRLAQRLESYPEQFKIPAEAEMDWFGEVEPNADENSLRTAPLYSVRKVD